jgi:hypothetical protein
LLAYAVALAVFLLIPPTLKASVGPPRDFTLQEAMDLLTPVVVIPLAWWVLDGIGGLRGAALVAFLVIAAAWVASQGIHLAANAIGDAFPAGPQRDAFYATDAGALDHFLDEDLGHWLWHGAWVALSGLMLLLAWRRPVWPAGLGGLAGAATVAAGLIHGFTFLLVTAEGGTSGLGIPASVAFLVVGSLELRRGFRHPVFVFLVVSSALTLVLDLVWAAMNGGQLVEPCSVLGC